MQKNSCLGSLAGVSLLLLAPLSSTWLGMLVVTSSHYTLIVIPPPPFTSNWCLLGFASPTLLAGMCGFHGFDFHSVVGSGLFSGFGCLSLGPGLSCYFTSTSLVWASSFSGILPGGSEDMKLPPIKCDPLQFHRRLSFKMGCEGRGPLKEAGGQIGLWERREGD